MVFFDKKKWQIIFQPAPVQPAPVHSKGEARHPDCSLKHLIAGDNDDDDEDDHDDDGWLCYLCHLHCGLKHLILIGGLYWRDGSDDGNGGEIDNNDKNLQTGWMMIFLPF